MQQLPTLLGQQYWELLHPFWHWCVNGCRNSQQCIMGRIQLIRLCKPFVICMRGPINVGKSCANGSNIVALLLKRSRNKRNVGSFWLKSFYQFQTLYDDSQQHACNRVCKWMQHVTSNNAVHLFARGLTEYLA